MFGGVGNAVWEVNVGGCRMDIGKGRLFSLNAFFSLKSEFDHNFKI